MKKLSYIIDIFLVVIILFLGYVQVSMITSKSKNHGVPQVFGSSILYVATDSMEDPSNPKALNPGVGVNSLHELTGFASSRVTTYCLC